jgi:hypothetical protein
MKGRDKRRKAKQLKQQRKEKEQLCQQQPKIIKAS